LKKILILTLGLTIGALPARANEVPLRDVEYVSEGIIATGIAYEIGRVCPSLTARVLAGIFFLYELQSYAYDLGYSKAEVDGYINDKDEKIRLEAVARSRLAEMGAVAEQPETYCTVGRQEIAAQSQIGKLLR
jgi:hypothetical protein